MVRRGAGLGRIGLGRLGLGRIAGLGLIVALGGGALAGCGRTAAATTHPPALDDAIVTTRVKTAFLNDPEVGAARIDVETFQGVVTLSGKVASKALEARAIALARGMRGVTDVKSTLQIQP